MKSLVDESEDRPVTTSVNPYVKENYWLINVAVLAIACLLLLIVIVFQYYMKQIKNFILIVILV